MQIKKIHIENYKILQNFTLLFPPVFNENGDKKLISVFIGENGSGKTTLLEAIIKIFSWFINDEKPEFEFEFEYIVRLEEKIEESYTFSEFKTDYIFVKLFSEPKNVGVICEIADKTISGIEALNGSKELSLIKKTIKNNKFKILPDTIAVYYAGESTNIKQIIDKHNLNYSEALRNLKEDIEPRLFFYYEPYHFNLLLLALLSFEYGEIRDILFDKVQYNTIHYFSITLKKPHWSKGKLNPDENEFWGAKGTIAVFLKQLFELSSHTQVTKNGIVLFFEANHRMNLYKLKDLYGTERNFFKILEMTWQNDLIESVDISITKHANSKYFPVNSCLFSEGEKQSIIILGLNELVMNENSIALYDEPDTYLHPKWQRDFISELDAYIENSANKENCYMITSHSPQLLSNAHPEKTFVKIFEKGNVIESTPKHYGRKINSILYNLMGVEERNKVIRDELSKLFTLIEDENIKEAEKMLKILIEILGENDPDIKNAEIQIEYLKEDEANS